MATNMTFVDFVTPVPADWLNNVNFVVNNLPAGVTVVANVAAIRALVNLPAGVVIVTSGYYTSGDGGGGLYAYVASDTTSTDNGGTILVDAGGHRWYLQGPTGTVQAKQFGAKCDGITDDTASHQNALNYLASIGGGKLILPTGITCTSATLTIQHSGVSIIGQGRGGHHDAGPQADAPTQMKWIGSTAAAMIQIKPATGAVTALRSCSVDGIMFLGNNIAAFGVQVYSCSNSVWRISGNNFTGSVLFTDIASGLSEASDVQQNDIWVSAYQYNAVSLGFACYFGASSVSSGVQGNFSFNRVHEITCNYTGTASSQTAVEVVGADNNDFYNIQMFRTSGGVGTGVRLIQSTGAGAFACQSNVFWHCSPGAGGFYSAGTEAGSLPAIFNNIVFYDKSNGPPNPVIGVGSSLWWASNQAPQGQRVSLNGSQNQIILADGRITYRGTLSVPGNSSASVTFPTSFTSSALYATAVPDGTAPGGEWGITCSVSGLTIYNSNASTVTFWWSAEGI